MLLDQSKLKFIGGNWCGFLLLYWDMQSFYGLLWRIVYPLEIGYCSGAIKVILYAHSAEGVLKIGIISFSSAVSAREFGDKS